ncbi:MAG: glycosyltransferase family 4 protein, partial [Solirubrobacteraceae bacterium]
MTPTELDALYAFLVAAAVAALLTPLTIRLARRVGAIDQPRERGLSDRETPRLGGLAIFVAAAVAGVIWLPHSGPWAGILLAATLITLVGALDDRFDFHPLVKLIGQIAAAVIAVAVGGVHVQSITLPLVGALNFPNAGPALAAVGLVGMMNVVNFSDGVDGLAAGVCAIVGIA